MIRITHIMADGSTRESIEGVVITNEAFYQVLRGIAERKREKAK